MALALLGSGKAFSSTQHVHGERQPGNGASQQSQRERLHLAHPASADSADGHRSGEPLARPQRGHPEVARRVDRRHRTRDREPSPRLGRRQDPAAARRARPLRQAARDQPDAADGPGPDRARRRLRPRPSRRRGGPRPRSAARGAGRGVGGGHPRIRVRADPRPAPGPRHALARPSDRGPLLERRGRPARVHRRPDRPGPRQRASLLRDPGPARGPAPLAHGRGARGATGRGG